MNHCFGGSYPRCYVYDRTIDVRAVEIEFVIDLNGRLKAVFSQLSV